MIACLPMYDPPWLRAANDRLWQAVRSHLDAGPEGLTRDADPWEVWHSPDLFLAQTCGLPYRARLHGRVQLVATPDHGEVAPAPGQYQSVLIRRMGTQPDLATARFAYNEGLSQSGWAAPQAHLARQGITLRQGLQTGAHAASARAVQSGDADFAALDCVTWAMLGAGAPEATAGLEVFDATAPTPALPFVTAMHRDPAPIAAALARGIADLDPADRDALCLQGVAHVPASAYLAVPNPTPPAA